MNNAQLTEQSDSGGNLQPKTRKGRESKQALLEAAREVFRMHGYAGARVTDMAAAAGMSNGAFYRYFQDKRDVLMTLLLQLSKDVFAFSRSPWVPAEPMASVYETTRRYMEFYRDYADLFRVEIEAAQTDHEVERLWFEARRAFFERIARALRRGQELGTVRTNIDPDAAAALVGGMTEHYAYLWFVLGRVPDRGIEEVSRTVAEIWAYGLFQRSAGSADSDPTSIH